MMAISTAITIQVRQLSVDAIHFLTVNQCPG
jgi:hypothetical protein